jgi:hypothetical protein
LRTTLVPPFTGFSRSEPHDGDVLRVAPLFAAAVLAVALADGALHHATPHAVIDRWASSGSTLATRPDRLFTSVLLTSGPRMTLGICLAFAGIAFAELRVGSRTTLLAGAAGTVVATVACDLVLLTAAWMGSQAARAAASAPDFGASAVTVGALGAASMTLGWWGRVALAVLALNGIALHHTLADWEHVVAFGVGALCGALV